MQPYDCRPITYLLDKFDAAHPWPCYWSLRLPDASFPVNTSSGNYHIEGKVRSPDWVGSTGKLVFPTYTWLTSPGTPRAKYLSVKLKTLEPPFTFQVAFKFSSMTNHPTAGSPQFTQQSNIVGNIIVPSSVNLAYQVNFNGMPGLSGTQIFNNNTFASGQAVYFRFQIEANLEYQYAFEIDGVQPAYTTAGFAPGDIRTATSAYTTAIAGFLAPFHNWYITPVWGGELDYLEMKIHDHTA